MIHEIEPAESAIESSKKLPFKPVCGMHRLSHPEARLIPSSQEFNLRRLGIL